MKWLAEEVSKPGSYRVRGRSHLIISDQHIGSTVRLNCEISTRKLFFLKNKTVQSLFEKVKMTSEGESGSAGHAWAKTKRTKQDERAPLRTQGRASWGQRQQPAQEIYKGNYAVFQESSRFYSKTSYVPVLLWRLKAFLNKQILISKVFTLRVKNLETQKGGDATGWLAGTIARSLESSMPASFSLPNLKFRCFVAYWTFLFANHMVLFNGGTWDWTQILCTKLHPKPFLWSF